MAENEWVTFGCNGFWSVQMCAKDGWLVTNVLKVRISKLMSFQST